MVKSSVPQQIRSSGGAVLLLPIQELCLEFERLFADLTLRNVHAGNQKKEMTQQLLDAELGEDTISLDEWFAGEIVSEIKWDERTHGLRQLKIRSHDLSSDAGNWKEARHNLNEIGLEAEAEIIRRTEITLKKLRIDHGNSAARKLTEILIRSLHKTVDTCQQNSESWTASESERLRKSGQTLVRYSKPRKWLHRLILKVRPDFPVRRLFNKHQQKEIKRIVEQINQGSRKRHRLLVNQVKISVLERLLGTKQKLGRFQELLKPLKKTEQHLKSILGLLKQHAGIETPDSQSCFISLVNSLNTIVNPEMGKTIGHLFLERTLRSGASPQKLAATFRNAGLFLGERQVRPHQWDLYDPAEVVKAILRDVRKYLGTDPDRQLNRDDPQTAADHISGLDLLSSELRPRLLQVLPNLIKRSAPYTEYEPVPGFQMQPDGLLCCHPTQRKTWVNLLTKDVIIAEPGNVRDYSMTNPWRMDLHQRYLSAPVGSSRPYWKWMSAANRAKRNTFVEPIFDHNSIPEVRVLNQCGQDHDLCEELFAAAVKCDEIFKIKSVTEHYSLTKTDPRLDALFYSITYAPRWHPAKYFHSLLKENELIVNFLQRNVPELNDFRNTVDFLKREEDAKEVAEKLTELGVLVQNSQKYKISFSILRDAHDVPETLYDRRIGNLIGLEKESYLSELMKNDLFFTILYCRVLDAYEQGRLSPNDTPLVVLERSMSLR